MSDRAQYLARTILSRVRSLEGLLAEDGVSADVERTSRRAQLLQKILAVEEGITSGNTVQVIAMALPRMTPDRDVSEREFEDFASILRRELKL